MIAMAGENPRTGIGVGGFVVMIGLAFASLVTWKVWLAKTIELFFARRRLAMALDAIGQERTLADAAAQAGGGSRVIRALIEAAAPGFGVQIVEMPVRNAIDIVRADRLIILPLTAWLGPGSPHVHATRRPRRTLPPGMLTSVTNAP